MSKQEFKRAIKYFINHGCDGISCNNCLLNKEDDTPENDLCKAITVAKIFIE